MRVFIPDRTGIYLPHSTQTRGNVTWLGFSGIIFVCAGLICLNFRARLLSRTTWKEKRQEQKQQRHQQQSTEQLNQKRFVQWEGQSKRTVSRPLPNPNGVFSDCYLTDGKHTREDPTQDLGGVQQPTLLHDCSNDDPSPKNMITVGCGCSLESQYVTPHGFRHGSIPSDGPVTASPVTSDSSRTRRIFHIPHWASRLVQYLSDLRLTSRVKSEMTKLPTSNADGSSSGCSSGSSADSHLSSTATGSSTKPAVYDRFSGVWSTWCVSPKHPRHDQSNRATPSMEIEPVKLPITSDYYEAVHTGSMVDDSVSLVSDPQLIDPVYSKIRGSKFVDPVPSDYDSVIGSEDWSVPPNDDRGSLLSYSSEESDHPSAHVYHQLIKRDAMPSEVTSIQPYVNYETPKCAKNLRRPENAANPASETNSNWSIRFSKSSPLRRVIDCVVSSRSNDSVTRLCQSTPPPQLPDRSYGQSTVNLVYRLRSLLRYKETRPEQTVAVSRGLSGPQYVKKAATLTTIVHGSSSHDSIQPSAALSCLNVNKCDANNLIDNTQIPYDKGISVHSANSGLHVTNTCERYLSSDDVIQQFYPSVTEIMSLHLPQCNLDSIRFEVKQTAQIQSPKLYLQKSANGSQFHLRWSNLAGSYGNIRHIDSEVDLLNTKSIIEHPGSVPQSTSTPLSSSPLVTGSLYPEKTEQPRAFWVDITTSPERDPTRMGAFSSPTKSLICATQNRTMMSPLMERSMEDDEVRHTLSHQ